MKYNFKKLLIAAIFISITLFSCGEDEYFARDYPRVRTHEVLFNNQAEILKGEILYSGDFYMNNHGFVWNSDANFEIDSTKIISMGDINGNTSFQYQSRNDFESGEIYFVRAFVQAESRTVFGGEVRFVAK